MTRTPATARICTVKTAYGHLLKLINKKAVCRFYLVMILSTHKPALTLINTETGSAVTTISKINA